MELDSLSSLERTHHCGALTAEHAEQAVLLMGWVARRRDMGHLIFIDLRDREGICQVVARPELSRDAHAAADRVRGEYVVAVVGEVAARSSEPRRRPEAAEPRARAQLLAVLRAFDTSRTCLCLLSGSGAPAR